MLELLVSDASDQHVRSFAKRINKRNKLITAPIIPMLGGEFQRCFVNSTACSVVEGGDVLVGWAFRTSPKLFIEAQQHAVVRKANGRVVDVTPHPRGEQEVCFLEDPSVEFSGSGGATEINRYNLICLGEVREKVQRLLDIVMEQQRLMLQTGNVMYGANMESRIDGLRELMAEILQDIDRN